MNLIVKQQPPLLGHPGSFPVEQQPAEVFCGTSDNVMRVRDTFAIPTVKLYTRHSIKCSHCGDPNFKACKCPKWIYCNHCGKDRRFSAKTRSWKKAEKLKREIEDELDPIQAEITRLKNLQRPGQITISNAVETYLSDVKARNLALRTQTNYGVTLRRLIMWSESNRLNFLHQLTTHELTKLRATWTDAPGTCVLRREVLSTFFNFCLREDWLQRNPARYLSPIRQHRKPTDWFPPTEFEQVVKAACSVAKDTKTRSLAVRQRQSRLPFLVLLMRASGLAIRDAVFLERERLNGARLFLYRSKTGEPVHALLEKRLAAALRAIPVGSGSDANHFFWDGKGSNKSVLEGWNRAFRKLFKLAAIRNSDGTLKWGHSHMLRDTYAIELLLSGVPIEEVSMLLGHKSIRTTERHYLPWVRARQEKLERSVKRAHLNRPITKIKTVGDLLKRLTGA